ncbi:TonB-dependent Receptor Plug Domain [Hymenobacter daecheongensis DSM 21074]|uniref:TonB-dependent Receptor Plug Domain n=1 Tax=Hymenobacter daecheongensis DSM 21074 TaxID=1121955 RepID=A0A1M6A0I0_9BACT|nr:TonB-dependent receptor [Hymenobacter daecheongensis]SHI29938.1 TonB-dependent Receptor Plug Domain [Hymenobacter daecheongensis DSM 21074]
MLRPFLLFLLLLLPGLTAMAQQPGPGRAPDANASVTLSGYLRDAANGEALVGASVFVKALAVGATANEYGFYSLTLPKGTYTITYTYLGYEAQETPLTLTTSLTRSVRLATRGVQTSEVLITGQKPDENVKSTEMSVNRLDLKQVKLMPALLGEVDVIRSIQLLPGISTVGEGAAGFNVRGGGVDQNLILLDEAPIYNASHLFGLFSTFNPDAVKDIKLVKGGIPAQYGGRLSSLLDVRMKEGNTQRLGVSGGVGLIMSRLAVEAPIVKDKGSFIVAGRRSYGDLFLKLIPAQKDNQAYFYDLSMKANYTLGTQDRLYVSGYLGRDVFAFGKDFKNTLGNRTGTVRWNHVLNARLFANVTGVVSKYDYGLGVPEGNQAFDWKSNIVNYNLKADFNYYRTPQSTLNFGAGAIYYTFLPGRVTPGNASSIFRPLALDEQQAVEYDAYLDNEQTFSARLSAQYGLRLSMFDYLGAGTVFDYEGPDGRQKTPVNPRQYGAGKVIKRYPNLEPRASLRYALSETSSLKASYNRMVQYIHLVSNTTASSPLDVWTPSTNNIRPEKADQVAVGYFRNFQDNAYEASVEVFGKRMDNQIDYINGANTLLNKNLEAELLYGRGRAYGAEFYVKKNQGDFTGWISYTLSRSERQINGLNNNDWYVNKYDKTHYLSVVGLYQLNPRWTLSGTFSYSTGIATTFPDSRYSYQGLIIPNVNGDVRNNYRVPAYHRLDLAATREGKTDPNRRWHGSWTFSVYNAYARRNAYSIYFRQNKDNPLRTEAVRLSVLGSVLPSASYNFNF